MKTKKEIIESLESIEKNIEKYGLTREREAIRLTLLWVLEERQEVEYV